jgi:hypothetical protein
MPPSHCANPIDDPVVFLHVPKTAGTSVRHTLSAGFGRHEWLDLDIGSREEELRRFHALSGQSLGKYRCICGHFRYEFISDKVPHARIFTFLRDPVDRFVSLFRHLKARAAENQLGTPEYNPLIRSLSFEEYVFTDDEIVRRLRDNHQTRFLGDRVALPMRDVEDMLALANERLTDMPFFGLVDRMDDSLAWMCAVFSLPPPGERGAINRARSVVAGHAREGLGRGILERIEETNRADIELYRFGCELFERRWNQWRAESAVRSTPPPGSSPIEPPTTRLRVSLGEAVSGTGWYAWDPREDGTYYRYTAPVATLHLAVVTDRGVRLRMELTNHADSEAPSRLRLTANGYPIKLRLIPAEIPPWMIAEGYIPSQALACADGAVDLRFESPEPVRPTEALEDADDDRLLGVAVSWIELNALGA